MKREYNPVDKFKYQVLLYIFYLYKICTLLKIKLLLFFKMCNQFIQTFFFSIFFQCSQIFISICIFNHNRHNTILQALPKENQPSRPTVPVWKWYDGNTKTIHKLASNRIVYHPCAQSYLFFNTSKPL